MSLDLSSLMAQAPPKASEAGGGAAPLYQGLGCPAPGGRGLSGAGAAATAVEVAEWLRWKPLGA